MVHAPLRDLKTEAFSAKPEAKDNEPVRDLNSELFPAKPADEPSEPLRPLAKSLVSEPTIFSKARSRIPSCGQRCRARMRARITSQSPRIHIGNHATHCECD